MKKRGLPAALCAVALLLTACAALIPQGRPDVPVIGVSINSLRSPFMIALSQGVQEKGEELGMKVIVSECNGDERIQMDQVQDFAVQGVDAILMEPLDADALVPLVERVTGAEIPVFCIDTDLNTDRVSCWVGADSLEMGRMAGRYIARSLREKYGEYRGQVVDLLASLSSTSGINRSTGFHEIIDQYPDIQVVATQDGGLYFNQALNTMADILQANPDIDAVWCSGDTNAQGVLRALSLDDRLYPIGDPRHITLVSADGAPESLDALREGYLDACISQNPLGMGEKAIEMIDRYLREGIPAEESVFRYPLFEITAETIDSPEFAAYGNWAEQIRYKEGLA